VPMDETRMPAQVFGPTIGIDTPWHTVLTLPDGQPVVIARPVGFGRLTLIGIDVTSQALMRYRIKRTPAGLLPTGTLPSAAVFWNPILARRGDAPIKSSPTAFNKRSRPVDDCCSFLDGLHCAGLSADRSCGGFLAGGTAAPGHGQHSPSWPRSAHSSLRPQVD
jgi:hypothetical protein